MNRAYPWEIAIGSEVVCQQKFARVLRVETRQDSAGLWWVIETDAGNREFHDVGPNTERVQVYASA